MYEPSAYSTDNFTLFSFEHKGQCYTAPCLFSLSACYICSCCLILYCSVFHLQIAEMIRHVLDKHIEAIPAVLEIPSKDQPYDPTKDSILKRARVSQ